MDVTDIKTWAGIAASVIAAFATVRTMVKGAFQLRDRRMDAIEKNMDDKLDQHAKESKASIEALHIKTNAIGSRLDIAIGEMHAMNQNVRTLIDHHIKDV